MKSHKITGGGGIQLHVVETGNSKGRPIMFIHGFSQSWLAWSRQMDSDLADDFRLVAMDMRGHGLSDKPREGYSDSRLWADDVNAVIQALRLDHPILCVLITHGAHDAVVKPAAVDQHTTRLAHAQVEMMANVGHAAFWDDAAAFNQRLRAFSEGLETAARASG